MASLPFARPQFVTINITCRRYPEGLSNAISKAFADYAQFCRTLLRSQREWANAVIASGGGNDVVKNLAQASWVSPCLNALRNGKFEFLTDNNIQLFIYMSRAHMRWLVGNNCLSRSQGDVVLACTIPPYLNYISLQEIVRVHNLALPGRYTSQADIGYFVAVRPSNLFSQGRMYNVRALDGRLRTYQFYCRGGNDHDHYDIVACGRALFYDEAISAPIFESSPSSVDLLYDYSAFLHESEVSGRIGSYPAGAHLPKVAIIEAGLTGLVAVTEPLRAGVKDLTVFESFEHVRDKAGSEMANSDYPNLAAEMGAMCFSARQTCLFHYFHKFEIPTEAYFLTPGVCDSVVHFRGARHQWPSGKAPPRVFGKVHDAWQAQLHEGCERSGMVLTAPLEITAMLDEQRFDEARFAWQVWLKAFRNHSFYTALVEIFTSTSPPGDRPWRTPEDFEAFGTLGFGFGMVSSVYDASFTEILRIVINGYHRDQRLIIGGMDILAERLRSQTIEGVKLNEHLCLDAISGIHKEPGKIRVCLDTGESQLFDRVILTSTTRGIQIFPGLAGDTTFFEPVVSRAISNTHVASTSSLLMRTKNKFWLTNNLRVSILSDGLVRELYCLDSEPNNPDGPGLVLLNYAPKGEVHPSDKTWRCLPLIIDLTSIFPEFSMHLVPLDNNYDRHVFFHGWVEHPYAAGGLKLNRPGHDIYTRRLFFQFQVANSTDKDKGLYLAGSDCSFGGLAEGAVQTALNAACAVIRSTGGTLLPSNPLDKMHSSYKY